MRGRRAGSYLYLDVHIEVGSPNYYNLSCFIVYKAGCLNTKLHV